MQPARFLLELQRRLPSSDLPGLVSVLLREPLIWNSLLSENVGEKFLNQIEKNGSVNLIPDVISMFGGHGAIEEELLQNAAETSSSSLEQKSYRGDGEVTRELEPPETLEDAVLLALELHEKFTECGSWDEVLQPLFSVGSNTRKDNPWQTPLALLYGMVQERGKLVEALLIAGKKPYNLILISHILVCNHACVDDQIDPFFGFLSMLNQPDQMFVPGWLNLTGSVDLARELGAKMKSTLVNDRTNTAWHAGDAKISEIEDLYFRSNLCQLVDEEDQSKILLCSAREKLRRMITNLDLQSVIQAGKTAEDADLLEILVHDTEEIIRFPELQTQLAFILAREEGTFAKFEPVLERTENPLLGLIYSDYLYQSQDTQKAGEVLEDAVEKLPGFEFPELEETWQYFPVYSNPENFIAKVLNQNAIPAAKEVCFWFLKSLPVDKQLNASASCLLEGSKEEEQALDYAQISLCLDPENLESNKRVANLWGKVGDWEKSYFYWDHIIQTSGTPSQDDIMQFARCAYEAGYYPQVLKACQDIFQSAPNDWNATVLTGKALWKLGDVGEAISCLTRATILAPEAAEPWIELARIQEASGNLEQSTDTLKAGLSAAPDSGELPLALADQYLSQGLVSESLPYLIKASELSPDSPGVALKLGNTQHLLGNLQEANQIFETAREKWVLDPDLALSHAKVLARLGESAAALYAMDVLFKHGAPDIHDYLFFAETITGNKHIYFDRKDVKGDLLEKAKKALEKVLDLQPGHYRANLQLAEILAYEQKYEESFDIYQHIINQTEAHLPGNHGRFESGFGLTALRLEHKEMALAALREATQIIPDNVPLQRLFAEAYLATDLKDEAIHIAKNTLEMESQNAENLLWYADFALKINQEEEAGAVLKNATRIAPDDPQTWFKLSLYYIRTEQLDAFKTAMDVLLSLDSLSPSLIQDIIRLYLDLKDHGSALSCIERVLAQEGAKDAETFFEAAYLYKMSGNYKAAMEMIQKAIEEKPGERLLHIFHTDLSICAGDLEQAAACLERAGLQNGEEVPTYNGFLSPEVRKIVSHKWLDMTSCPAGFYTRNAYLKMAKADLDGSSEEIAKALETCPDHIAINLFAADLALSRLDSEKAKSNLGKIVDLIEKSAEGRERYGEYDELITQAVCLSAEIALDEGDQARAKRLTCLIPLEHENLARVMALQARLKILQGEWKSADETGDIILSEFNANSASPVETLTNEFGFNLCSHLFDNPDWFARAMLDLCKWEASLAAYERMCRDYPGEPNSWLSYAKALTTAAEAQRLFTELKCEKHAPGVQILDTGTYQKFTAAIEKAGELNHSPKIDRWRVKGEAAFQPNDQSIRRLGECGQFPDDIDSLIAALRQAGKSSLAMRLIQKLSANNLNRVQHALLHIGGDLTSGIEIIQQASSEEPDNPIILAAQALLAEKSGQTLLVLQALVSALQIWDDEPEWHAWAARAAKNIGATDEIIHHLKSALTRQPNKAEYAHALGNEYLAQSEGKLAVETFNYVTQLDPDRLEGWIQLAKAYQVQGDLDQAISVAEKTTRQFKSAAQPMILLGKLFYAQGNKALARNYVNEALAIEDENVEAIIFLSKLLVEQEQPEQGIEVLDKALEAASTTPAALPIMMAKVKTVHQVGGAEAALPLARAVVDGYPTEAEAFGLLAEILADSGDLEGAELYAQQASNLKSTLDGVNLLLGKLKWRTGNLDQAVHYLTTAIQEAPTELEAYLDLGHVFQDRRELTQALSVYKQAIQIAPSDYKPYYLAAIISRELKDYVEAETMLRKAAELSPDDVNIRRQLSAVIALNLVHNTSEVSYYL